MPEPKAYRLPSTATPERYQIRLAPDLGTSTFTGEEKVTVRVHEPVREIVLNAAELEFQNVSIRAPGGMSIRGSAVLDRDNEQARLEFPQPLDPGLCELQLTFSGILNNKLHGFYRSTYKNAEGKERGLASTQFESTDARRAFP